MIKFFRRIRQRLLSKNKLSKYLFYAIGEIILVVIGILIALQINNWNENRKQLKEELVALNDVRKEFESNYKEVERLVDFKKKWTQEWENYLSTVSNKSLPDSNRAIPRPRMGSILFIISYPVLNSILSTGKIDRIQNDSLKQLLVDWNNIVRRQRQAEQIQYDYVQKEFVPFEAKFLPNEALTAISGTDMYFHDSDKIKSLRLKTLENLEYQNSLIYNKHLLGIQVTSGMALKELHEQAIKLLDDELAIREKNRQ